MNARATITQLTSRPVCDLEDEDHGFTGEYGDMPGVACVNIEAETYERNGETYIRNIRGAELVAFDMGGLILDRDTFALAVGRAAVDHYETVCAERAGENA